MTSTDENLQGLWLANGHQVRSPVVPFNAGHCVLYITVYSRRVIRSVRKTASLLGTNTHATITRPTTVIRT